MSAERDLSEQVREDEEKTELSDRGMAMDADEIPHTAAADPDENAAFVRQPKGE